MITALIDFNIFGYVIRIFILNYFLQPQVFSELFNYVYFKKNEFACVRQAEDLGLDLRNLNLHDLLDRPLLDVRNLDNPLDVLDLRDLDLALLHDRHRLVDDALLHLNLRNLNNLLNGLDLRDFDDLLDVLNLRDLL